MKRETTLFLNTRTSSLLILMTQSPEFMNEVNSYKKQMKNTADLPGSLIMQQKYITGNTNSFSNSKEGINSKGEIRPGVSQVPSFQNSVEMIKGSSRKKDVGIYKKVLQNSTKLTENKNALEDSFNSMVSASDDEEAKSSSPMLPKMMSARGSGSTEKTRPSSGGAGGSFKGEGNKVSSFKVSKN